MKALTIANFGPSCPLSIPTEAELAKQTALTGAKAITEITNAESQQAAVDALSQINGFLGKLEKGRTEVKAPVLKLAKDIDTKAKEFGAEVEKEKDRLSTMINAHVRAEAEKAAKKQRMADDMARKKREREEAEAERLRQESLQLEEAAQQAANPEEATQLAQQAEEAARTAEQAAERADSISSAVVVGPARSFGLTQRKVWKHEVTDVRELYRARPELCEVTPKTSLIHAVIRQGGERKIPGLRIYEEIDTSVRA